MFNLPEYKALDMTFEEAVSKREMATGCYVSRREVGEPGFERVLYRVLCRLPLGVTFEYRLMIMKRKPKLIQLTLLLGRLDEQGRIGIVSSDIHDWRADLELLAQTHLKIVDCPEWISMGSAILQKGKEIVDQWIFEKYESQDCALARVKYDVYRRLETLESIGCFVKAH